MILKILHKNEDKLQKTINTKEILVKNIYVCRVVSNYPDINKVKTVMQYGFFVKKNDKTYIHIVSGKEFPNLSVVATIPTMFAISDERKFSEVFPMLMREQHLTNSSSLSKAYVQDLENESNKNNTLHSDITI